MRRRFVVCTHAESIEKETAFRDKLSALGLNWWHWLPGTWLIIDHVGTILTQTIRDIAMEILGNNVLVIQATGSFDWAGYGPTGSNGSTNMFKWINDYWDKPDYPSLFGLTNPKKLPSKN